MKKIFILLLVIGYCKAAFTQSYTHQPIRSYAPIPSEILQPVSVKVQDDFKTIEKSDKGKTKRDKEYFYYESNFYIDKLLRSGKVVFNNELYNYVNKVADHILQEALPDLKGKIKIYPVKSPVVNAYATDRGIIFINTGLLAYLQNEAQLAFVISHEIAHYVKRHNVNFYITSKKIDREKNDYSSLSNEEAKVIEKNTFSREQEVEADNDGIELFSKTSYSASEAVSTMEMLRFADLAFDYKTPFKKDFLELSYLKFPDIFFDDKILPAFEDTALKEEEKTHPSIESRIANINIKHVTGGNKKFIVSEEQFQSIKQICLHEQLIQLIKYRDFIPALYHGFLLSQYVHDTIYVRKNIARALLGITLYYNSGKYSSVVPSKEKIRQNEGEITRLYYLFNHMKAEDINILTIKYSWLLWQQNPEDIELSVICKSAIENYKRLYSVDLNKFRDIKEYNDSIINADYKERFGKNDNKIKKGKRILASKKTVANSFTQFALSDIKNNPEFIELFNSISTDNNEENSSEQEKGKQTEHNQKDFKSRIVIIDPEYLNIDMRKENQINFPAAEKKQTALNSDIILCAEKSAVEIEMWNSKALTTDQIELFNDIAIINERSFELDINGTVPFPAVEYSEVKKVAEKYGLQYVCQINVIGVIEKKNIEDYLFTTLMAGYMPLLIPVSVYMLAKKEQVTIIYINVFNIADGKIIHEDFIGAMSKDNPDLIKSHLYNFLLKMKKNGAK